MPLESKEQAFKEFKAGTLHSGPGGPKVTKRKQAIAIALSVARRHGDKSVAPKKSGMSRGTR